MQSVRRNARGFVELQTPQMPQALRMKQLYNMLGNKPVGNDEFLDAASSQNALQRVGCLGPPWIELLLCPAESKADRLYVLAQARIAQEDLTETLRSVWAFFVEHDVTEAQSLHLRPERLADERKGALSQTIHPAGDVVDDLLRQ
jgi:hypothetical protein